MTATGREAVDRIEADRIEADRDGPIRRRAELRGLVQGVGFRPHVARTASRFAVSGLVGNDDESVFIEAQGLAADVGAFFGAILDELPPLALVTSQDYVDLAVLGDEIGFRIVASRRLPGALTLISPDIATCTDCLAELYDPANRRYQYPFITCTNCGPRLSIVRGLPYDRPATTMADFPMCPACAREYGDPANRRFHAQPISCFDCGPRLWLAQSQPDAKPGPVLAEWGQAVDQARAMLAAGRILAVKGIGGFTLMCDARNPEAVQRLRQRKRRPGKPLAVMAASVASAARFATLSAAQARELASPARPIVLAPMASGYDLAPAVAPGLDDIGVMLPYSPIHHLLIAGDEVLVATSANSSSKPLTYGNDEAIRDLSGIVDAFVMHDRPIHVPVEDSVVMAAGDNLRPIRRSRGYAPLPVRLGQHDAAVLATGGELKNTFAITRDGLAFLSAHIGDMGSLETQRAFEASVEQMTRLHRRRPDLIVTDRHPGYATRAWAERRSERTGADLMLVQHHHAHALSLVAEHGTVGQPLICAVFDGTGYGDDATIWGGEVLRLEADPLVYQRTWHLPAFWLPGGDTAIRAPWKVAIALLAEFGIDDAGLPPTLAAPPGHLALVRSQLANQVAVVRTTSAGRLFDAVASLLGLRHQVTYEAQAAMELECLARQCRHLEHASGPPTELIARPDADQTDATRADASQAATDAALVRLLADIVGGIRAGQPTACLARLFHAGLAAICVQGLRQTLAQPPSEVSSSASPAAPGRSGQAAIGLSGGVFMNRIFSADVVGGLADLGYSPLVHRIVPAGDGGLSLGQALAGYLRVTREV